MNKTPMRREVVHVQFNHTDCGVPFLINVEGGAFLSEFDRRSEAYTADFFEIRLFPRDSGYVWVDGERIELRAGTILFLSPQQYRRWELRDEDFKFLIFVEDFVQTFLADGYILYNLQYFYQYQEPTHLVLNSEDTDFYWSLLAELQEELRHINVHSERLLSALLSALLLRLNKHYCKTYQLPYVRGIDSLPFRYKALLEEYIGSTKSIDEYAGILGVGRAVLDKALLVQFGSTASTLHKRRLLIEVKKALLYSDLSITEIADRLNFSEGNHLMRFFKRMTGQTISAYMEQAKNGSIVP